MVKSIFERSTNGRVFIRSDEADHYELLENAAFCKLDLTIYKESNKTEVHPLFEKLKGRKISLSFRTTNPMDWENGNLREVEFEAKVNPLLKLGEYPKPDLENFEEATKPQMERCRKLDLVTEENLEKIMKEGSAAGLAFLVPGKCLLEQEFYAMWIPLILLDDAFLEDSTDASLKQDEVKNKSSFRSWMELLKVAEQFCRAHDSTVTGWLTKGTMSEEEKTGSEWKLLHYVRWIKQSIQDIHSRTKLDTNHVWKKIFQLFTLQVMETSKEWDDMREAVGRKNLRAWRQIIERVRQESIASVQSIEAVVYQAGIELSPIIRDNILLKMFVECVGRISQKMNDLTSYAKEVKTKESGRWCNEVYLLHVDNKLRLEDALAKVVKDLNDTVEEMELISEMLLKLFPEGNHEMNKEREELSKFIKVGKEYVCGFIVYHIAVNRYHKDLVVDCYVH